MGSWIFQANPDKFDIDGYLALDPPSISWLVRQHASKMQLGDQVFLWRAIGNGDPALSGIVAECRIAELPTVRVDDLASAPFWKVGGSTPDNRARLEVVRIELKNRFERHWLDDDPILTKATILTLRAGTNFQLSEAETLRLDALWRRAKAPWSYAETVAGIWAFSQTLGTTLSRKPQSPISEAALRTGRVVKGMYNRVLNFRALDPTDARKGLSSSSALDQRVWDQFFDLTTLKLDTAGIDAEFNRLWPESPLPPLPAQPTVDGAARSLMSMTLAEMLAKHARSQKGQRPKPRTYQSVSNQFERDPLVVAIARKRAGGSCEIAGCAHPLFNANSGDPFLEVHHIVPLAEGGADGPDNVACLCPSHHREAHHGENAAVLRSHLVNVRLGKAALAS